MSPTQTSVSLQTVSPSLSQSFSSVSASYSRAKFGDSHYDDPTCPNHVFQRILKGQKCSVHDSPVGKIRVSVIPSPRASTMPTVKGTVFFSSNAVTNNATEAAKIIAKQTFERQTKKIEQLERFRLLTLPRTSDMKKAQPLKKKGAASGPQTPAKAAPSSRPASSASKGPASSPSKKGSRAKAASGSKSTEKSEYIRAVKKAQSSLTTLAKRI